MPVIVVASSMSFDTKENTGTFTLWLKDQAKTVTSKPLKADEFAAVALLLQEANVAFDKDAGILTTRRDHQG